MSCGPRGLGHRSPSTSVDSHPLKGYVTIHVTRGDGSRSPRAAFHFRRLARPHVILLADACVVESRVDRPQQRHLLARARSTNIVRGAKVLDMLDGAAINRPLPAAEVTLGEVTVAANPTNHHATA